MAALAARRGPVADLVPTQAAVAEPIVDEFIAFGGDVVIGFRDFAAGDASGERGSVLDDQRVRGHVVDASVEHFIERTLHVVVTLSGSSVDQVQVDVVEPGGSRGKCRCRTRTRRMRALQRGEHVWCAALHSDGDSREPTGDEILEHLLVDGVGIGFCGHLHVGRDIELVANTGEQITQRRCTDERRCSATEEDGVHLIRRGENARRHGDFRRKMGVEGGPIDAVP